MTKSVSFVLLGAFCAYVTWAFHLDAWQGLAVGIAFGVADGRVIRSIDDA